MAEHAEWPEWFETMWWREAWLTLEAAEPATLPPYLGSTLRGALGHLLRTALCDGSGCGHECQRPDACRYFSLFEQNQAGAKPFVLLAPPPPELEEIAHGAPVNLPYRSGAPKRGESIPTLRCEAGYKFDPGGTLRFGLRLMGQASNALAAIVEAVGRQGLSLGGGGGSAVGNRVGGARFRLASAVDGHGAMIFDRRLGSLAAQMPRPQKLTPETEKASRVRIVFLSPVVFKVDRAPEFSPRIFADRFVEQCVGRAVRMQHACTGQRVPWIEAPKVRAELVGHRLFHYDFPRHSFRQDKWLDFDGTIGYFDLSGELGPVLPWARAAEVLHWGEKAAFGLGKIRVLVLE